jgi:hypothetical protein
LVLNAVLILLLSGQAGLLHKFGSPASLHLYRRLSNSERETRCGASLRRSCIRTYCLLALLTDAL